MAWGKMAPIIGADHDKRGHIASHSDARWLDLWLHCADVAATVSTILAISSVADRAKALKIDVSETGRQRIAVLAFLHDIGKALPGFQDKVFQGCNWDQRDHVGLLLVAFNRDFHGAGALRRAIDKPLGLDRCNTWFGDDIGLAAALLATIGHHGGRPRFTDGLGSSSFLDSQLKATSLAGECAGQIWQKGGEYLGRLFPMAFADTPGQALLPVALHWISGLIMIADWIGSDAGNGFPLYAADAIQPDPVTRYAASLKAATETLGAIGFSASAAGDGGSVDAIIPAVLAGHLPRSAQLEIPNVPLDSRLVLIEAPTGCGKTEAAVMRFLLLAMAGLVDGIYFAVPTRSAGYQLYHRMKEMLGRFAPALGQLTLPAIGGAKVAEDADRDIHDDEARSPPPWAMGHMKRRLTAPAVVGTIDQVYLSGMRVKHGAMRSFLLSRMLLVVDEVHAADPYMTGLTAALVQRQLASGGYALLMSATLGSTALAEIVARKRATALPSFEEAVALPYPAIRHGEVVPDTLIPCSPPEGGQAVFSVRRIAPGTMLETVSAAVAAGARVLVIRSTVRDAVANQIAFEDAGMPMLTVAGKQTLHHGRFLDIDRTLLNDAIDATLGKACPEGVGFVCVATQTAEQSLDIDADLLITDPCPADILLQRFGRLWRHVREWRPEGMTRPEALILDPGPLEAFIGNNSDRPTIGKPGFGFAMVYSNLLAIEATLRWLDERNGVFRPSIDNRSFVEAATHRLHLGDLALRLDGGDPQGRWSTLHGWLYGRAMVKKNIARQAVLPLTADICDPREIFVITSPEEGECRTRIGGDRVEVRCTPFTTPFGQPADALTCRWQDVVGSGVDDLARYVATATESGAGEIDIVVGRVRMRYSRHGLAKTK